MCMDARAHATEASSTPSNQETVRRCWVVAKKGSVDNLQLRTESLPAPSAGHASVEVKAIGLNFADVFSVLGLYSATPRHEFIPGLEFAGVVTAVGPPSEQQDQGGAPSDALRVGKSHRIMRTHTQHVQLLSLLLRARTQPEMFLPACMLACHAMA